MGAYYDSEGLLHEGKCDCCHVPISSRGSSSNAYDMNLCGGCYNDYEAKRIDRCAVCDGYVAGGDLCADRCRDCHARHRRAQWDRAWDQRQVRRTTASVA